MFYWRIPFQYLSLLLLLLVNNSYSNSRCQHLFEGFKLKSKVLQEKEIPDTAKEAIFKLSKGEFIPDPHLNYILTHYDFKDLASLLGNKLSDFQVLATTVQKQMITESFLDYFNSILTKKMKFFSDYKDWSIFLDKELERKLLYSHISAAANSRTKETIIGLVESLNYKIKIGQNGKELLNKSLDRVINQLTFIKSSKSFEFLPMNTRRKIESVWGYNTKNKDLTILPGADHIESVSEFHRIGKVCGKCDMLPRSFNQVLSFEKLPKKRATLIQVNNKNIGVLKNIGDNSFLATAHVKNAKGELILVEGGVYGVSNEIYQASINVDILDLTKIKAESNLFFPITFMRAPKYMMKDFTPKEFKLYKENAKKVLEKWNNNYLPDLSN